MHLNSWREQIDFALNGHSNSASLMVDDALRVYNVISEAVLTVFWVFFFFSALGINTRSLYMLSKQASTTELYPLTPTPAFFFFLRYWGMNSGPCTF